MRLCKNKGDSCYYSIPHNNTPWATIEYRARLTDSTRRQRVITENVCTWISSTRPSCYREIRYLPTSKANSWYLLIIYGCKNGVVIYIHIHIYVFFCISYRRHADKRADTIKSSKCEIFFVSINSAGNTILLHYVYLKWYYYDTLYNQEYVYWRWPVGASEFQRKMGY